MSIRNHVNLHGSRFHIEMLLGMKSTFIVAEIKIVCKMGSFIHVLMYKC